MPTPTLGPRTRRAGGCPRKAWVDTGTVRGVRCDCVRAKNVEGALVYLSLALGVVLLVNVCTVLDEQLDALQAIADVARQV